MEAKGFCLTKQQIVDAKDRPLEKVFVPEWADGNPEAYVMIKSMSAGEKGAFEESLITPASKGTKKPEMDMTEYGPKLALVSMCDDDGNRLFSKEDLSVLAGKGAKAMDRVISKAMEINGIVTSATEKAAKNSLPGQSDSLPSN